MRNPNITEIRLPRRLCRHWKFDNFSENLIPKIVSKDRLHCMERVALYSAHSLVVKKVSGLQLASSACVDWFLQ